MPEPRRLLPLLGVLVLAFGGFEARPLEIALGEIDITPPVGSPMAGYSARRGVAESIHDPLSARLLLLKDGETSLALLTFDLRRLASPRLIEAVKSLGVAHVVLASSHTHSGPDADREDFPAGGSSWRRSMEAAVLEMVRQAQGRTFPARLAVGKGSLNLGHNRRLVDEAGRVTMLWRNAEARPTHPIDPTVGVIRVDDLEGRPRAVLVHYACHAVVLGPDNLALSADYPGAMRRRLAGKISSGGGDAPLVFFLQGAAGDINPYRDKQPVAEGGFDEAERVGADLAEAAFNVFEALGSRTRPEVTLRVLEDDFDFEDRWDRAKRVPVRLLTVLVGPDLALVALAGEPFVEFQLELTARSPVADAFVLGYAVAGPHPWPGYIPTIQAATEGGYGAGYNTQIEVGAGETLIDRAVIRLYQLSGRLGPAIAGH